MDSKHRPMWPSVVLLVLGLALLVGCIGYIAYIFFTDPTAGGKGWVLCIGGILTLAISALLINYGYRRLSGHDLGAWEAIDDFLRGVNRLWW